MCAHVVDVSLSNAHSFLSKISTHASPLCRQKTGLWMPWCWLQSHHINRHVNPVWVIHGIQWQCGPPPSYSLSPPSLTTSSVVESWSHRPPTVTIAVLLKCASGNMLSVSWISESLYGSVSWHTWGIWLGGVVAAASQCLFSCRQARGVRGRSSWSGIR